MMAVTYGVPRKPPDTSKADGILETLCRMHAQRGEVCLREAEAGQTGKRFDLWTMAPSWRKTNSCGYEIKTSYADFKRDAKWNVYLPYCERFYFACPAELLSLLDIPKGIGLVWVWPDGRIEEIAKAKRNPVTEDARVKMMQRLLFRYVFNGKLINQPPLTKRQAIKAKLRDNASQEQ
jgi:hypothetical protein